MEGGWKIFMRRLQCKVEPYLGAIWNLQQQQISPKHASYTLSYWKTWINEGWIKSNVLCLWCRTGWKPSWQSSCSDIWEIQETAVEFRFRGPEDVQVTTSSFWPPPPHTQSVPTHIEFSSWHKWCIKWLSTLGNMWVIRKLIPKTSLVI